MRSIKYFELANIINFIVSLGFIVFANIINYTRNYDDFIFILVFLITLFLLVIAPFSWICHTLYNSIKKGVVLSKKYKIAGTIFHVIFSLLTILLIVGSVDLIMRCINQEFKNMSSVIFMFPFWLSTIFSIYLSISYWFIRNGVNNELDELVLQIGDDTEH